MIRPHVEHAQGGADHGAVARQQRLGVPNDLKLLEDPTLFHCGRIGREFVSAAPLTERRESRFRRQHARLHGVVAALDPRHVHEPGGTSDEHTARETQLRDRL